MTPDAVRDMPWRLWTAMALSVDDIRKKRREEAERSRRAARSRTRSRRI